MEETGMVLARRRGHAGHGNFFMNTHIKSCLLLNDMQEWCVSAQLSSAQAAHSHALVQYLGYLSPGVLQ
jgi:hypothetical protein